MRFFCVTQGDLNLKCVMAHCGRHMEQTAVALPILYRRASVLLHLGLVPICLSAFLPICLSTYLVPIFPELQLLARSWSLGKLHLVYCLHGSRVYLTVTRIPPSPSTSPWLVRNWTGQDCRQLSVPRAGQVPWVLCPWVTHGRQELQEVCLMLGAVRT